MENNYFKIEFFIFKIGIIEKLIGIKYELCRLKGVVYISYFDRVFGKRNHRRKASTCKKKS